jgi:hypothetical protein
VNGQKITSSFCDVTVEFAIGNYCFLKYFLFKNIFFILLNLLFNNYLKNFKKNLNSFKKRDCIAIYIYIYITSIT